MVALSILIPVYNAEERLPRLLEGLVAQTDHDFEVIVVDDGSVDGSLDVARSYGGKLRMKILKQVNSGAAAARNTALKAAASNLIWMVDADDLVHPRAVEFMLAALRESNADYLVFDYRDIAETDASKIKREFDCAVVSPASELLFGNRLRWFVDNKRNPGVWQFCFRREAIRDMRFVEGITLEDNLFVFPFLARSELKAAYLPIALYAYLQQPMSVMHTSKLEFRLKSFDAIFHDLRKTLSEADYRFLMTRHFVPELKTMYRAATFLGKRRFAAFMRGMRNEGLVFLPDFPLRWKMRFLFVR